MRFRNSLPRAVPVGILVILLAALGFAATPASVGFLDGEPTRAIRYTFPDSSWPNTLPPLCAMARDLPLLKATGANAVLTEGAPPEDGDHIFLSLLASTELNWIASFPPGGVVDPARPLLDQRDIVLAHFARFITRFGKNPNLRAVVLDFGPEHAVEGALLAPELAAILTQYRHTEQSAADPASSPPQILLGQAAYTADSLFYAPEGLDFWLYRFDGPSPSGSDRQLLETRTPLPIVFDLSSVATEFERAADGDWSDFLTGFTAGAPAANLVPLRLIGHREAVPSALSGAAAAGGDSPVLSVVRYREDAVFRGRRDSSGFENIELTPFGDALIAYWHGDLAEELTSAPALDEILNAATETPYLSPGTRIRVHGSLLGTEWSAPPGSEWPLHAGTSCFCAGDRPIAIGAISPGEASAQLPWLLPVGRSPARFIRQGLASASHSIEILDASPGVFPLSIERADSACSVGDSGGVRPGEMLEIQATGTGPVNGSASDLAVLFNEVPLKILDAGLVAQSPGVALLRVRMPPRAAQAERSGLFLRRNGRASNLIPVDFAGDGRPTVSLTAERTRILLQPGGLSAPLRIAVRGVNGYCGAVEFDVEGLPKGVTALIKKAEVGEGATLQLRADVSAEITEGRQFYLYALPTPGDLATLALELRIMPQAGEMRMTLESRGYAAGASASVTWNGELLAPSGSKAPRGLYLQIIDPRTGIFLPIEHYDLWESAEQSDQLEARLRALRPGVIVGMVIADDATLHIQPSLRDWIRTNLGSSAIETLGYQHSWALLSRVGSTAPIAEDAGVGRPALVEAALLLPEK